jgi:CDP-diacylglycerol--glycerol-3-phosphate 3-phosphatidyltransferase
LAAAVVFVVAAVTDLLDGYLARRHSQITRLGRLLDPIADKLLVLSGLILLVQFDRVAAIVAILIIAREVAVTGVRAISAAQGIVIEAETTGKYKMVVQVVAIVFLLLEDGSLPASWHPHEVGTGLLYVALALALYSGQRYLVSFWQQSSTKGL